jgi:hypothetical protein
VGVGFAAASDYKNKAVIAVFNKVGVGFAAASDFRFLVNPV